MKRLSQMLKLWGDGKRTTRSIPRRARIAAGRRRSALRRGARKAVRSLRGKFVPLTRSGSIGGGARRREKAPKSAEKQTLFALSLLRSGDVPGASEARSPRRSRSTRALPTRVSSTRAFRSRRNVETPPSSASKRMIADGQDGFAVRMLLSEAAEVSRRADLHRSSLEAAGLDPTQVGPLLGLLSLAQERKDDDAMRRPLAQDRRAVGTRRWGAPRAPRAPGRARRLRGSSSVRRSRALGRRPRASRCTTCSHRRSPAKAT